MASPRLWGNDMTERSSELRTRLGKVRGLGAAKSGVGHWWLQRLTALALIPLTLWFLCALLSVLLSPNVIVVAEWFASPVNTLFMILFVLAAFMHAKLGVQVIVEDYVHGPFAKYSLLLLNNFACFALAALSILAALKLHFLDVVAGAM